MDDSQRWENHARVFRDYYGIEIEPTREGFFKGFAFVRAVAEIAAYERTKNGAHMLRVFQLAYRSGLNIPDTFLRWLDEAVESALAAESPAGIVKAFGMSRGGGGPNGNGRRAKTMRQIDMLEHRRHLIFFKEIGGEEWSDAEINREVARHFNTTEATVRDLARRWSSGYL